MSLLLSVNIFYFFFFCFYCWLWAGKLFQGVISYTRNITTQKYLFLTDFLSYAMFLWWNSVKFWDVLRHAQTVVSGFFGSIFYLNLPTSNFPQGFLLARWCASRHSPRKGARCPPANAYGNKSQNDRQYTRYVCLFLLEHVYVRPEVNSDRFEILNHFEIAFRLYGSLHWDFTAATFQTIPKLYCTWANDIY